MVIICSLSSFFRVSRQKCRQIAAYCKREIIKEDVRMNNDSLIEKRRKEIYELVEQFESTTHLKMIIEILKSMLNLIKKGRLCD